MDRVAADKIGQVRIRYIFYLILADVVSSAAIAILISILPVVYFSWSFIFLIGPFILTVSFLIVFHRPWRVSYQAVAGFLDISYPELEESTGMIFMQPAELDTLQLLQLKKVASTLKNIPSGHRHFTGRLRFGLLLLFGALILAFIAVKARHHLPGADGIPGPGKKGNYSRNEVIPPQIKSISVAIRPPAYTRLPERRQEKFTLELEEGSAIGWNIVTNIPVRQVSLLFNERDSLELINKNRTHTQWSVKKMLFTSGFYQVVVNGKRSDLYQVQVIKDQPPVITIKAPKQYTYIDAGEKPQVAISAVVTDDYGVSDAMIYATIAKGTGEAVKFKEQKIPFDISFKNNGRKYGLQKTLYLLSFNMEPEDELYFYVGARDNHGQSGRTDVYVVSIQDTAQLLSMDGILSGANIKPEYFRSERQIILDAERLLKERDTISLTDFKDRSNDLGTDQKLLRLRYGKFLGEEAEGNIGDPRLEDNRAATDPKDFGNGAKILDEYTDKHDNAEDAQFFDPTVKAQLKATLTEMWKAELQLRLYQPREALPFAYKALRLLKDLQQKSRSYVAKTAYNPSPLKMEKRLSGDLSAILQPDDRQLIKQTGNQFLALRKAVSVLEQLKAAKSLSGSDRALLQGANQQLTEKATQQPGLYLGAAGAMRRLLNSGSKYREGDIAAVESAIRKILPASQTLPQNAAAEADMGLSKQYFLKVDRLNR